MTPEAWTRAPTCVKRHTLQSIDGHHDPAATSADRVWASRHASRASRAKATRCSAAAVTLSSAALSAANSLALADMPSPCRARVRSCSASNVAIAERCSWSAAAMRWADSRIVRARPAIAPLVHRSSKCSSEPLIASSGGFAYCTPWSRLRGQSQGQCVKQVAHSRRTVSGDDSCLFREVRWWLRITRGRDGCVAVVGKLCSVRFNSWQAAGSHRRRWRTCMSRTWTEWAPACSSAAQARGCSRPRPGEWRSRCRGRGR